MILWGGGGGGGRGSVAPADYLMSAAAVSLGMRQ